jgi:hypothetical protein
VFEELHTDRQSGRQTDRQTDLVNEIGAFLQFFILNTLEKSKGEMVFELQYNIFNKMGQSLKHVK